MACILCAALVGFGISKHSSLKALLVELGSAWLYLGAIYFSFKRIDIASDRLLTASSQAWNNGCGGGASTDLSMTTLSNLWASLTAAYIPDQTPSPPREDTAIIYNLLDTGWPSFTLNTIPPSSSFDSGSATKIGSPGV